MADFTKSTLQKLQPDQRRYSVRDTGNARSVPGLILRVSPTGVKTFQLYRKLNGKPIRVTLGRFPSMTVDQARRQATHELAKLNRGVNPNVEKRSRRAKGVTLRQVLDDYCADRRLKPSTEKMYRDRVGQYLKEWLDRPLTYITRERVVHKHKHITAKSETSANKVMRILRALFEYAAGEYLDEHGESCFPDNPVRQLSHKRIWHREGRRTTRISSADLRAWFEAVSELDDPWGDFLILVLLTGLRRREAQGLAWSEIDLKEKMLTVPGARTKNGHDHTLPLTKCLLEILKRRQSKAAGSSWVFPSHSSRSGHIETPTKPVQRIREVSGINFTVHDLRRTFASVAERLGITGYTLKRLLNHRTGSDVTTDYVVLPIEDLRQPLEQINDAILTAGGMKRSSVVNLVHHSVAHGR